MSSSGRPAEREARSPGLAQEQGFRQGLIPVPTAVAVSKRPARMQRRARHHTTHISRQRSFKDDRHLRIRGSRATVPCGGLDAGHPPAGRPQDPAAQRVHGTQPQARHRRASASLGAGGPGREHGHRHPRRRIGSGHRRRTGAPGQGRRGERHQRTQPGAGRVAGHVEQHGTRHRLAGTPPVLQGARRARVEGRCNRGRRHPAARPQVQRGLAVDSPFRRDALLVHSQRLDHQPDPPYQRSGYPAVEVGGLPAQTGAYDAETSLQYPDFTRNRHIRHPYVQSHQHIFEQNAVKPGQQRQSPRHHVAGRMGIGELRAGRPSRRARRHQPAQTTVHRRDSTRPSGQGA